MFRRMTLCLSALPIGAAGPLPAQAAGLWAIDPDRARRSGALNIFLAQIRNM
jgi:hypothetical protein